MSFGLTWKIWFRSYPTLITGCSSSYSRDSCFEYQVVVGAFDARDVGECERFCVDSARCTGFGFMAPRSSGGVGGGGGGGIGFGIARKNCEITDRNLRDISRNMASTLVSMHTAFLPEETSSDLRCIYSSHDFGDLSDKIIDSGTRVAMMTG